MPSIPATIPVFSVIADDVDDVLAEHQNTPNDEITNLATFLGMMGTGKTQAYGTDVLAALCNAKAPSITKASASEITVGIGTVWIKNSAQSNRMPRRNTATVSVTASNLDVGAMAAGYYYLYAVADSTGTTFTVKFSTSATTPTGLENYELIGWFYNESGGSLDITNGMLGGVKNNGRDVANAIKLEGTTDINTASTSLVDMTSMTAYFYTSGRPVMIMFDAPLAFDTLVGTVVIDIAGATKRTMPAKFSFAVGEPFSISWMETLAAGTYTIKIRWKVASGTGYQYGASEGSRLLRIVEL